MFVKIEMDGGVQKDLPGETMKKSLENLKIFTGTYGSILVYGTLTAENEDGEQVIDVDGIGCGITATISRGGGDFSDLYPSPMTPRDSIGVALNDTLIPLEERKAVLDRYSIELK